MSVKAVHIELVSELTTKAFLACLRRFIARCGKPRVVWSDHGTNFVGASRELKELRVLTGKEKSRSYCRELKELRVLTGKEKS